MTTGTGELSSASTVTTVAYLRRFYRPDFGRGLNRDPIGDAGGKNLYMAFNNAPLTHFNPLGFKAYVIWHLPGDDLALTTMQWALAKKFEDEHVSLYLAYDKCREEFKQKVENICACREEAERQRKEAEDWLERKARHYKEKNEFLDRKGGPHGH